MREIDDPRHRRLVGEDDLELGKIDLRLVAGRRFETNLIAWQGGRTQILQHVGDSGVAASVCKTAACGRARQPGAGWAVGQGQHLQ